MMQAVTHVRWLCRSLGELMEMKPGRPWGWIREVSIEMKLQQIWSRGGKENERECVELFGRYSREDDEFRGELGSQASHSFLETTKSHSIT
jgi:hypothetical protein